MFLRERLSVGLMISLWIFSNSGHAIYQSRLKLSNNGYQFQPVNYPAQILKIYTNGMTLLKCAKLCDENILCRMFDINALVANQCRLFQGDMNIHGNITNSSMTNALVGYTQYSQALYFNYGQPCSMNAPENRYLVCGTNFTWQCPQNTYWNSITAMCRAQSPVLGSICQQNLGMCRQDLNFTCLRFNQCGPLSLYLGTTILNSSTVIAQSSSIGLSYPYSIIVNRTTDNSIIVTNTANSQVVRFYDNGLTVNNVSLVSQNWSGGSNLDQPQHIVIHPNQKNNLFVSDYTYHCVIKISNIQGVSPTSTVVAGVRNNAGGSGANLLNNPSGVAVDSSGNLYIADSGNHRVMRWPPNGTSGSMIAGVGTAGADSFSLNKPMGLLLDENNSYLYVCDSQNNRIQRFSLLGGSPNNGTTIAGGNGSGPLNTQLNNPFNIYISTKTQAMYIADSSNHRIQLWSQGGQSGVTIAGDPNGNSGGNASTLNSPYGLALNAEETFLYVVDTANSRIQRFQLV